MKKDLGYFSYLLNNPNINTLNLRLRILSVICSSFDLRASHWSVKFNYFSQIGTKYAKNTAIKIDWRVAVQLWVLDILSSLYLKYQYYLSSLNSLFYFYSLNIWLYAFLKNYFLRSFYKYKLVNNKIWYWKKIIINK